MTAPTLGKTWQELNVGVRFRAATPDELVHVEHCCSRHGCKYAEDDCPVALQQVAQKHDCEYCWLSNAEPA
jgi:hypothetical protein